MAYPLTWYIQFVDNSTNQPIQTLRILLSYLIDRYHVVNCYDAFDPTNTNILLSTTDVPDKTVFNNWLTSTNTTDSYGFNINSATICSYIDGIVVGACNPNNNINIYWDNDGLVMLNTWGTWTGTMDIMAIDYSVSVQSTPFPSNQILCFLGSVQLKTTKGYIPISEIDMDAILICKIGNKRIHSIKSKKVYHTKASPILYKYDSLLLTKMHSLLLPNYESEEQHALVVKDFGVEYTTDSMVRVPIYLMEGATVYEEYGIYTIYHVALMDLDVMRNHAIYANGILVESCQIAVLDAM